MADTSPCPRCGAPGSGNFCPECGASRGRTDCRACGHTPEPGARFCTRCGRPLNAAAEEPTAAAAAAAPASPAGGAGREAALGWWVAGLTLVALILFVAYPVLTGANEPAPPAGSSGAPRTGAPAVDLGSMTPREAADRLYNRVMAAAERGDSAEVTMFLPMSIAAYERARPLDEDGLYHLALLQRTAADAEGALATAREALDASPEHLLALGAAADAAEAVGRAGEAREYWARFLEAYDAEMAEGREEYGIHTNSIDQFRRRAQDATAP